MAQQLGERRQTPTRAETIDVNEKSEAGVTAKLDLPRPVLLYADF